MIHFSNSDIQTAMTWFCVIIMLICSILACQIIWQSRQRRWLWIAVIFVVNATLVAAALYVVNTTFHYILLISSGTSDAILAGVVVCLLIDMLRAERRAFLAAEAAKHGGDNANQQ